MLERVWGHVRGNVVGYAALFVALSGTGYAAVNLPRNSVGTKQLKKAAVTGKKVAAGTLTARNIKLSTLGFQSRVTGTCSGNSAISQIAAGGSVSCQPTGSGTITGVLAGTDLTGGGSSGDVTISADESKLQHRLTGGCAGGQAIQSIDQSGNPSCQAFGTGNGTVTSVGSGPGLIGGPITGSGNLALDPLYRLPQGCANTQVAKWNGAGGLWTCADDQNSGGTVTSVASGTGLSGGPITGSGTLSLAPGYRLPQSCSSGRVPTSTGSGSWNCGTAHPGMAQMMGGSIGPVAGTQSLAPFGLSTPNVPQSVQESASAVGSTAGNLNVNISTAPGAGNEWTFALEINGTSTVNCNISGTATSCSNTSNTQHIPGGAELSMTASPLAGSPPATRVTFGWTDSS